MDSATGTGIILRPDGPWKAIVNLFLRATALGSRFLIILYLGHRLGLESVASYGLVAGAAATMTVLSGLGITYRMGRLCVRLGSVDAAWRVRDRGIQRLIVGGALLLCAAGVLSLFGARLDEMNLSIALIVLLEPIVADLHDALIYRHRPAMGNLILALRSIWITPLVMMGIIDIRYGSLNIVYATWATSLIFILALSLALASTRKDLRSALLRPVDWLWLRTIGRSSPIVFGSELGSATMLYSDRYIIALLIGERAAGAYTLLWSITNVIPPLLQAGVFNRFEPKLLAVWQDGDVSAWHNLYHRALWEGTRLSIGVGIGVFGVILLVLPLVGLAQSPPHLLLAVMMIVAMIIRMRGEIIHAGLYSAERDSDWIAVNIVGLGLGPVAAVIGVTVGGMLGAGAQMVFVAWAVQEMRRRLLRSSKADSGT